MTRGNQPFVLATVLSAFAVLSLTAPTSAESLWGHGHHGRRETAVSLFTHELQPISGSLGFRVNEASVKDRQVWVIGEIVNVSHVTFSQVRLTLGVEYGAEQRLLIGRLVPGASRRVQVRLATEFAHAPGELRVNVVDAVPDYRPKAQPWRPSVTPASKALPSC